MPGQTHNPRLPVPIGAEHPGEDTLERYALGVIRDETELARLEEHLLACPGCVARTEAWESYIYNIQSALRQSLIQLIESGP